MTPERLYTLNELAELTGQRYDFWDREIRSGRLRCIRRTAGGNRYVSAGQYAEWFRAQEVGPERLENARERALAAVGAAATEDDDLAPPEPWEDL